METLKFILKSLFSNGEVATKGKKQKWVLTFIIMLVSLILAILPSTITELKTNGSNYISNYESYYVSDGLVNFSNQYLKDGKLVLKINENNELDVSKSFDSLESKKTASFKFNDKTENVSYAEVKSTNNETILVVSYIDKKMDDSTSYIESLEKAIYLNNIEIKTENEEETASAKVTNSLFFFKDGLKLNIVKSNTSVSFTKNETTNEYEYTGSVQSYTSVKGSYSGVSTYKNLSELYTSNINDTENHWKTFFNEAYKPLKKDRIISVTVLYLALDVVAVVVMIFTTFIMSRFKSSLCDKLSIGDAFKYVVFLSLTPGILAFVVGYIMPSFAPVSFFTFLAFRCIFFNTKLTRGDFNQTK